MRNAEASVDPPTDPFEAVPPAAGKHPVRPASGSLPPGVSPDIFQPGRPGAPLPFAKPQQQVARGAGGLPPPVPPVEPWPLKGPTLREQFEVPPPKPVESAFAQPAPPEPEEPEPSGPGLRRVRRVAIISAAAVVILAAAYLIPAWMMSGKVLPGTTVAGADVGGLTPAEAAERLTDRLSVQADADIAVKVGAQRFSLSPLKAGLSFDIKGTVAELPVGFPGPGDVWRALTSQTALRPRISVNDDKLNEHIVRIAAETDRRVYQGAVVYRGLEPVVVPPRAGRILDQRAAAEAIKNAYLDFRTPVDLVVHPENPRVTAEAIKRALPAARQALSGPITLVNGTRKAVLPVEVIAANLRFVPDGGGVIKPEFDARTAIEGVEKDLLDPATAPRDATFGIVRGKPALIPGRAGRGVDTAVLASAVTEALTSGGGRTIDVSLTTTRPRLDNAEATRLGIKDKISEYVTTHACCESRVTNIHRIADLVDGRIVKPGETFSLNDLVGRPDEVRGFVEAPAIENGRVVTRVGGGLSQFATTMHNAVFYGGLRTVKRTPHDFHVSRYPTGRDAALAYPEPDLRWKNDSKYGVLIHAAYTDTTLTVALWSTRRYDRIKSETSARRDVTPFENAAAGGPDCVATPGANGFTVTVTRVFYRDGVAVKRDRPVTTVYRPQPKITCTDSAQAASSGADRALRDSSERDDEDTVVPLSG